MVDVKPSFDLGDEELRAAYARLSPDYQECYRATVRHGAQEEERLVVKFEQDRPRRVALRFTILRNSPEYGSTPDDELYRIAEDTEERLQLHCIFQLKSGVRRALVGLVRLSLSAGALLSAE